MLCHVIHSKRKEDAYVHGMPQVGEAQDEEHAGAKPHGREMHFNDVEAAAVVADGRVGVGRGGGRRRRLLGARAAAHLVGGNNVVQ